MEVIENKFKEQVSEPESGDVSEYDPKKKYKWEPSTKFVIEGQDFGLILNTIRSVLNTPEAQKILMLEMTSKVLEETLAKAVNSGIVKEDK